MDLDALFKIQCGLFVAAVATESGRGGCITNTLMQQTHLPVQLSLTLEKAHHTHRLLMEKGSVGVSALARGTEDLIRHFGFTSGRDGDKLEGIPHTLDGNRNPLLAGEGIAAAFSLDVTNTLDLGTHTLFVCKALELENREPGATTYSEYRASRAGFKNKESEAETMKKYVCTICGYVYDPAKGDPDHGIAPGTAWEDVPEDYVCPACGVGKEMFEEA